MSVNIKYLRLIRRFVDKDNKPVPVPPIKRTKIVEVKELSEETKTKLVAAAIIQTKIWGNRDG